MVIDKKFKGLAKEDFRYVFNGDIETTESLEIDLDMRLFVTGSINAGGSIKAGWDVKVGWHIEAGGYIEAGGHIEAGRSIEAGVYIEAGWSIKAGGYIEAGRYIKAGESIEAGWSCGIVAGLSITCKGTLSFGVKAFAGICSWKEVTEEEKTVTCGKLEGGVVEYGILKETGLEEDKKVELSMDEIAEKFGVAVKDLKIKKG